MPVKKTNEKKLARGDLKRSTARTKGPTAKIPTRIPFPIVGLGASAGGLEALRSFFAAVPHHSGMAFIVVVHMSPQQPSMMPELLQKITPVPVSAALDGQAVEPDHIYVVPPGKEINMFKGSIQLLDYIDRHAVQPIDRFLKSLALDQGALAVAVILSGTGTDGSQGIKEIKAGEGLVLVQTRESSTYDGMPLSAIHSGSADMILRPEAMPRRLTEYFTYRKIAVAQESAADSDQRAWLNKIIAILRTYTGHDFSQYKLNTVQRRIIRRMGLNQIGNHRQYVRFLRENPSEADALFRELLIGVTSFFRDAQSFEVLKASILPELLSQMKDNATFRAWIPGCSTGEEIYSLAMVLREVLGANPSRIKLQLFGTDLDSHAIDKARTGLFPASIATDVNPERLKRFFSKEGGFFRIRQEIRDCTVFSVQNVIKDPPFSRLQLLCCRNLMIYLDGSAQKKLLPLFHYTLAPNGVLMLGSSETIGGFSNLFKSLDKKWKIYKRREIPPALKGPVDFPSGYPAPVVAGGTVPPSEPVVPQKKISQVIQRAVLEQFAPSALLIDTKGEILFVQGRTGKYLETPVGPPTQNILDMARHGLQIELSAAIRAAAASNRRVTRKRIAVRTNGDVQLIDLHVCPQTGPREIAGRLLVVFQDVETTTDAAAAQDDPVPGSQASGRVSELERELQNARESHQTAVEELESSNEELKSINEEMQSANEELQSTNEELESSKEELQSLNEELQTVNTELQAKVEELSAAHDDMRNLLNSTQIATIFVDNELLVRRFTPEATAIINLIPTDIGRPLQHVVSNLSYPEMIDDLREVLRTLSPRQAEVQTLEGGWHKMRIIPYRTMDNRIDGAVLTFAAIDEQKQTQAVLSAANLEMKQTWQLVRDVFDLNTDPLAVLDDQGRLVIANTAFAQVMKIDPDQVRGLNVFKIEHGLLGMTELTARLKEALVKGENFQTRAGKITQSKQAGKYFINGRIIRATDDGPFRILLRFEKER